MKNLSKKITLLRAVLSIIIIFLLIFPLHLIGLDFQKYLINSSLIVNSKYFFAGILFVITIASEHIETYLLKKNNEETKLGKLINILANTLLINSVLIILATVSFINAFIPVIIIARDSIINVLKIAIVSKDEPERLTKIQSATHIAIIAGITLTLFYNLPFELWNLRVGDFVLAVGATLSVISGIEYYYLNKDLLENDKNLEIEELQI